MRYRLLNTNKPVFWHWFQTDYIYKDHHALKPLKLNNQMFTEAYFVNSDITIKNKHSFGQKALFRYSQRQKELFRQPQPSV